MRRKSRSSRDSTGPPTSPAARQVPAVAADDIEVLPPRPEDHGVRPVLALALEAAEQIDPVEPVVAVGVADPIQPRPVLALTTT